MKKIIVSMMLSAAAAAAFVSCQKPELDLSDNCKVCALTFTSEKPALDNATKTEWNGTTIQWSAGDRIRVAYTAGGAWQNVTAESAALEAASSVAKFAVNLNVNAAGPYRFYGVYPSSALSEGNSAPTMNVTIPAVQTPSADSYDSAADLMTSTSDEQTSFTEGQDISLRWTRLVAHANITMKGLKNLEQGEKVTSIVLTANPEADMVGSYSVNLTDNAVAKTGTAAANVLTVKGDNLVFEDSDLKFWASFLPVTVTSLKVVVETDKATYTRSIDACSLVFKQNKRNLLTINMENVERVAKKLELSGIDIPSANVKRGVTVSFKATGLAEGDKIVFSAGHYPGNITYETDLTLTADGASFVVPDSCYGRNKLTVRRGGLQQTIGVLCIAVEVGDVLGGGVVYYTSAGGIDGLIINKVNIGAGLDNEGGKNQWGPTTSHGTTSTGIYTGKQNTRICVEAMKDFHQRFETWPSEKKSAAELCDEYTVTVDGVVYDDWFLPSLDEMVEACKVYAMFWDKGVGLIANNYWTSSQGESASDAGAPHWSAFYVNFYEPLKLITGLADKEGWTIGIRPIRQF